MSNEKQPEEPKKPIVPDSLDELLDACAASAEAEIKLAKKAAKHAAAAKFDKPTKQPTQPSDAQVAQASTYVRRLVVGVLKSLSPSDYQEYVARKFANVAHGDRPSLEQSTAAYLWAFERFLAITYKESGV